MKKRSMIQAGASLRDAIRCARKSGCKVFPVRRTGEIRFVPLRGKPVTCDGRRKDAPHKVITLVQRLMQERSLP